MMYPDPAAAAGTVLAGRSTAGFKQRGGSWRSASPRPFTRRARCVMMFCLALETRSAPPPRSRPNWRRVSPAFRKTAKKSFLNGHTMESVERGDGCEDGTRKGRTDMGHRGLLHVLTIAAMVGAGITACKGGALAGRPDPAPPPRETEAAKTYTGLLQSGLVGIGGEHTGWALITVPQDKAYDLDPSKVMARARQLDGKRVTITGTLREKTYVERGKTLILVADSIEPAP